jgi:hypothetical protein
MAKFKLKELVGSQPITVRPGSASARSIAPPQTPTPTRKLASSPSSPATDAYVLCAVGDPIQAVITGVETYTADDFSIGSVDATGRKRVLLDGSEAAGTGSIAIGDYVVTGTPVAKDTALTILTPPKVAKPPTNRVRCLPT